MTYNIHHANPPSIDDSIDINAISRVILQQRPDLVALQEVDVHTGRSGKNIDQAAVLAQKTGMRYYFAKSIDHDGGDYGVAILSRHPITNPQTHRLPTVHGSGGEPRVLATATIEVSPHQKILFASTHFDAQKKDTNRLVQIRALKEILKTEKLPVIIGGDFNAEPSSRVINILDEQFTRTCINNCGFTIPVLKPSKTIDYIAYSPASSLSVVGHRVIQETYASDHLPVIAVFELKK
jgi:endonuclease/exonuclease/phosphatase family metal-dependent hydrolase